jgi:hypothetical protein
MDNAVHVIQFCQCTRILITRQCFSLLSNYGCFAAECNAKPQNLINLYPILVIFGLKCITMLCYCRTSMLKFDIS